MSTILIRAAFCKKAKCHPFYRNKRYSPRRFRKNGGGGLNNFFRLLFLRNVVFCRIFLFFRIFLLLLSVVFFFFRKLPDHLIRADRRKSARSAEHNGNNDIIRRNDFGQSKITNNAADNAEPRCNQGNKPLEFFVFPHGMFDDIDHPIHDRRYCGNAD